MDILVGILFLVVGLTIALSGLRVFFFMLPIVGMVSGFLLGTTLISNWLGDGFLATATGWIVGLVVGLVFAIVSYLYWYVGALMAAGSSGALLTSGLFALFGVNSGVILASFAIVGAVIFIFVAMALNLPIYVVLVNTALMGAYVVIGGLMLIFDRAVRAEFDWGVAVAAANDSWFWWLVLAAVMVVGILVQAGSISTLRLPEEKWTRAEPA